MSVAQLGWGDADSANACGECTSEFAGKGEGRLSRRVAPGALTASTSTGVEDSASWSFGSKTGVCIEEVTDVATAFASSFSRLAFVAEDPEERGWP